jgi:uncharacterized protein YlxP (DUF503 family)
MVRGSQSLKDKRQVVRSIKDRMSSSFNVSVAEVESEEHRQLITLGFAMVSNEVTHVRTALEKIVAALRGHPIAEFIDSQIEV